MSLLAIFGNPVSHSISPRLHNAAMQSLGIKGCYIRHQIIEPTTLLSTFKKLQLNGANVTVPHKEAAFEQCDEVRGMAKKIGAVNTLVNENGKIIGYNTDASGFYESIKSFGSIKNALILGAGGTAKAIAVILKENNIKVTILNRSASRLDFFKENGFTCSDWESFTPSKYELIINTTSAGLKDEQYPLDKELLEKLFTQANFAYDVIYNKKTPFLALTDNHKITYKDGKDMLLYQAVLAFNLFFNNRFKLDSIEKSMRPIFEL